MDERRLNAENAVLARHLPANLYRFEQDGKTLWLKAAARTNRGHVYTLAFDLGGFPAAVPKVYVTQTLKDKQGIPLLSVNGKMHVLGSDRGWTRICHYGSDAWTPMVSLFKVYVKCRLWLEMYELHLQTGKRIDYYLNHQH